MCAAHQFSIPKRIGKCAARDDLSTEQHADSTCPLKQLDPLSGCQHRLTLLMQFSRTNSVGRQVGRNEPAEEIVLHA